MTANVGLVCVKAFECDGVEVEERKRFCQIDDLYHGTGALLARAFEIQIEKDSGCKSVDGHSPSK